MFVTLIAAAVMTYAPASLTREVSPSRHYLFHAAYLLCLVGLLGMVVTGDLFNVFVFLEISSLSSYALISLGAKRRALTAAFQYLVLGTIGATFFLIGVGFILMMTGSLNMADIAERLQGQESTRAVIVAFTFMSVGIALKMALFPLHAWLPNAYTYSPSVVSAFLAATATKVSVYTLIRLVSTVMGPDFSFGQVEFSQVMAASGLLGMFFGAAAAIVQTDVKRMLAYSSISQVGYMALGIGLSTSAGFAAAIAHLFNHALTKGALFLAVGCVVLRLGDSKLETFRGVGRRMPITTFLWVLAGLSLIGVPATAGFVSKWLLVQAALDKGLWVVSVAILLSSLLAVVYVWRIVEVAYFKQPVDDAAVSEAPLSMLLVTAALTAAAIWFGIDSDGSAGIALEAAQRLLGGGA